MILLRRAVGTSSLNVRFECNVTTVPPHVLEQLSGQLREFISALDALHWEHPLRKSLAISELLLTVGGWRFSYRIDRSGRAVVERAISLRWSA